MRIVTLLPSATEIVCALGLREQLVGVSHECDVPAGVERLPRVTRSLLPAEGSSAEIDAQVRERRRAGAALYELDAPRLRALQPDLLVTQSLCQVCAVADDAVQAALAGLPALARPRVIDLAPATLAEVFAAVQQVGEAAGRAAAAAALVAGYRERLLQVERRSQRIADDQRPSVVFLEWLDPLFVSGHWNPALVRGAGGRDALGDDGPSRRVGWEELAAARPEVLFIACCGFPVRRALADLALLREQRAFAALPAVRAGRVYVADGNAYFSRPGPRLLDGLEILAHALHPAVHPSLHPSQEAVRG